MNLDTSNLSRQQLNILGVYLQATTIEKQRGREWYDQANRYIKAIAERYNCTVVSVAGVVAALSPNMKWEKNLEAAEELVHAYTYGTPLQTLRLPCYKKNVVKAWNILHGKSPLSVLGGNKVRSFYYCLLDDSMFNQHVCVDGHAYCVAYGLRLGVKQVPRVTPSVYLSLAEDYQTVAKLLHIRPCVVQATTWLAWKRLHSI
jgi:hypothetical protein